MPRTKNFSPQKTLIKAMNLFWEQGYHATSMQDLVDRLEINRASLYDTYGGKKQLFESALQHYREKNYQDISALLYQHPKVKDGLKSLFELLIDSAFEGDVAKGCLVVNTTTELAQEDEFILEKLNANKHAFEKLYQRYLNYGIEKGQLAEDLDVETAAKMLYALQAGLRVQAKCDTSKEELMQIAEWTISRID